MKLKFWQKRYLQGFQTGVEAGYDDALTRIEAMLHYEIKALNRSKHKEHKEVRISELVWVLSKVKGFRKNV